MGTHPIFESDFDCLTEMYIGNQKILIFIQILFIGFDLFVNVCIDQIAKDFTIQLVILVFQLIILLLSLLLFLLAVFNTYPVQSGHFKKMIAKFRTYYIIYLVYLGLTIILNSMTLKSRWEKD